MSRPGRGDAGASAADGMGSLCGVDLAYAVSSATETAALPAAKPHGMFEPGSISSPLAKKFMPSVVLRVMATSSGEALMKRASFCLTSSTSGEKKLYTSQGLVHWLHSVAPGLAGAQAFALRLPRLSQLLGQQQQPPPTPAPPTETPTLEGRPHQQYHLHRSRLSPARRRTSHCHLRRQSPKC